MGHYDAFSSELRIAIEELNIKGQHLLNKLRILNRKIICPCTSIGRLIAFEAVGWEFKSLQGHQTQMTYYNEHDRRDPRDNQDSIFVFGSNLAGRHGSGAALFANYWYGAQYGIGRGRTGNAYAIPTKDADFNVLALAHIQREVAEFLEYARYYKNLKFFVTRIGCGYAGYSNADIAPLFIGAPDNCTFEQSWKVFLT